MWEISPQGMRVLGFLEKAIRLGWSGRQTLLKLREYGLGYRTQVFYRDWRILQETVKKWENMRYIRKDALIKEDWYTVTASPLETNYQTTFEIRAWDMNLKDNVVRYVTVGHDQLMKRADLERMASAIAQGTSPSLVIDRIIPVRAFKSPVEWI